ncbi:hypothetical protein P8452_02756 [Trifolium repens]|nr:hypothetical protein P8452_02756 [Trifolium repens]
MTHYNSKSDSGPMVIIIKHAQIKEPKGLFDLTISNAWSGTKLILDPQLEEITKFTESLPESFTSPTQAGFLTLSGSGQSSQTSQTSQYSVPQRYTFNAPPKHLSELMSCAEDEIVTTVGTAHHVIASKHGWFYLCCDHCSKSIITKSPPYTCSDPKHVSPDPKMKYKVEVEFRFQDSKIRTVVWDREYEELIGHSASELKAIMVKDGAFDAHEYPTHLDKIVGTELALKVKAQPSFKMVYVLNYKKDPDIIQHIKDQFPHQETTSIMIQIPETTPEVSQQLTPSANETQDSFKFETQDLANTADSDLVMVMLPKAGKRQVSESSPDEAKFSSNKVRTNIKIEGSKYKK